MATAERTKDEQLALTLLADLFGQSVDEFSAEHKKADIDADIARITKAFETIRNEHAVRVDPSILLKDAQQDIQFAIAEGGLTPAHERMIDAMQKILTYLEIDLETLRKAGG